MASPLKSLLSLALGLAACSGGAQNKPDVALENLPVYGPRDAQVFDDNIEAAAFGLALDRPHFKGDPKFRQRAQLADAVGRYKITTVTAEKEGDKNNYKLQLTRVGAPYAGLERWTELEIEVKEGTPSYALVSKLEERASGKTVVAMWKRFRQVDEAVVHWYVAPDDEETVAAVKEALVVGEVGGK